MKYRNKQSFERKSSWFKFDDITLDYIDGMLQLDNTYHPQTPKNVGDLFALIIEYRNEGDISAEHKELLSKNPFFRIAFEHITDCIYESDLSYNKKIESGRKGGLSKATKNTPVVPDDDEPPFEF